MAVTRLQTVGSSRAAKKVSDAEIQRRVDFADAALGAAGHEVTDPVLNSLARQVAAGTLSADTAIELGFSYIDEQ